METRRSIKLWSLVVAITLLLNSLGAAGAVAGMPPEASISGNKPEDKLLAAVKRSPEFCELKVQLLRYEPSDRWSSGGVTYFNFSLQPLTKSSSDFLIVYPYVIFAVSEVAEEVVEASIVTINTKAMQAEIQHLRNPEYNKVVVLSEGVQ